MEASTWLEVEEGYVKVRLFKPSTFENKKNV